MKPYVVIEFPMVGRRYFEERWGVYCYDEYPEGCDLAGLKRRTCLDSYDTVDDAVREYPDVDIVINGSGYEMPVLE
jgi:hypothetical protein